MDFLCIFQQTNIHTSYHCMILIDIFVVLSKLFALIKFIVTYDCDVNSHLFYFFGIFAEIRQTKFRHGGFSAKWLFGEVVFGKVSCIVCINWRTKPCHFNWPICRLKTIVVQSVNNLIVL